MEFIQPEPRLRDDVYRERRLRMVRGKHELPESLLETAQKVTGGGVIKRAHATVEMATAAKKGTLLSATATNQKLKKWQDSKEGLAWQAVRDKMFQADDADDSSG